jgi:thiosulfate/3-mercaptopyruvate sulfurtransferase
VGLPALAQRDHEKLRTFEDAFDLEREKLVGTLAQSPGGFHALVVDKRVDLAAQDNVGDADEPPWLHQADARARMRRLQQPREDVLGHHRAGHEPAHVPAFGDGSVDGVALGRAEGMLGHAGQRMRWQYRVVKRSEVLITASELAERLHAVTILDVRWQLAEPDGRAAYEKGHIPGAVYVSLEDELTDHAVTGRGRHPLPSGRDLEAAARRWGVRQGVPVVVYDDWNRAGSARAWWVLTAAGVADVRILDGGLSAWNGSLETETVTPEPGDVPVPHEDLYDGARPTLTADQVGNVTLLDARAPERFRGDVEPMDPVAGHIPGAKNVPSTSVLTADGVFLPDGELTDLFDGVQGESTGVYCGSGVTAAVTVAALAAVGVDAALYPGSWSEWCSDPARPVARGS